MNLSPSFKFHLFKEVYQDSNNPRYDLKEDDKFFKKEFSELSAEEISYYASYFNALTGKLNEIKKLKLKFEEEQFQKREYQRKRQEKQEEEEFQKREYQRKRQEFLEEEEFQKREHERKRQEFLEEEEFQEREHDIKQKERQRKLQKLEKDEEIKKQEFLKEEEFKKRERERKRQERQKEEQRNLLSDNQKAFIKLYKEKFSTAKIEINQILILLDHSLIFFMQEGILPEEQKIKIRNFCYNNFDPFSLSLKFIFELFKIEFDDIRARIPVDFLYNPIAPNELCHKHQIDAQKDKRNFIYAYPEQINMKFPVYCCHPVFCDFLDIINDNKSSQAFRAYSKFIDENMEKIDFDGCVDKLISAMLSVNSESFSESVFVREFVVALGIVFPIISQAAMPISARDNNKFIIDAGIFINNFPFILVEAKHMSYSIDAVLQGLQYYGLTRIEMIDNNPCFLLTIDHGILFVYGVATVSQRVVCDFLASFEFTNYHFNLNNFLTRLFRCISGFYYFYKTFSDRIKDKSSDPQHQKYNLSKNRKSPDNQPFPAIFDIKDWNSNVGTNIMSDNDRIPITFKEVQFLNNITNSIEFRANLSKNVFLVQTDCEEIAVLKICSNYGIQAHALLAEDGLAPKIIGYEKLSENCHLILMEYLHTGQNYMSVLEFCSQKNDEIRSKIIVLLKDLLKKIQAKGVVHGDFRCTNIFMKVVDNNTIVDDINNTGVLDVTYDIVLADNINNNINVADDDSKEKENMDFDISNSTIIFKIIDFEFSGMQGELYPCLALKNRTIPWHQGFKSFLPRQFDHDDHMLEKMTKEFNCMPATCNVIFNTE